MMPLNTVGLEYQDEGRKIAQAWIDDETGKDIDYFFDRMASPELKAFMEKLEREHEELRKRGIQV